MLPVPFIIVFIRKIFAWLRAHWPWMNRVVSALEARAESKGGTIEKYGKWGLLVFVAIPAPGTGAWTGSLAAALLDLEKGKSFIAVICGVLTAGIIMGIVSYGLLGAIGLVF